MGTEHVRARVCVAGLVQGVFFRAHTRDRARQLGLVGFVRNLPDGRVEVVLEGTPQRAQRMVEWCRRGPAQAAVETVDVTWEEPTGEFSGFSIRY